MLRILRRLFVAVSFILIVDLLLLWQVTTAGWIALGCGLLGSILLIVPPLRIEYWKANRSKIDEIHPNPTGDVPTVQVRVRRRITEKIEEWDEWDTFIMMLGGVLLAFHFIFQGVWEHRVVERQESSDQINSVREQLKNEGK